jgi:hypothetical protein
VGGLREAQMQNPGNAYPAGIPPNFILPLKGGGPGCERIAAFAEKTISGGR